MVDVFADYDECSSRAHACSENAKCTNNDGSYSCTCNEKYTGDGTSCTSELHIKARFLNVRKSALPVSGVDLTSSTALMKHSSTDGGVEYTLNYQSSVDRTIKMTRARKT